MRPTIVLLVAEALGSSPDTVMSAAVAIELVHNFSLIHDDIIDGDDRRRGRATVWKALGPNAALLAGDALLTLAFEVLLESDSAVALVAARHLGRATLEMVDGEASEGLLCQDRAQMDDCIAIAQRKTGALFRCACELAGLFGDATQQQCGHLQVFGERVGLAFQIVDDVLAIWGGPGRTGKPECSDLRNRRLTFPVVAALESGTQAGRELHTAYSREQGSSPTDVWQLAQLIERAGARAWCEKKAMELIDEGISELRCGLLCDQATIAAIEAVARHPLDLLMSGGRD